MLSNQTFRDVFKADNLSLDQRLKITSLTFLFTDLKGSTALYERVGDLAAFDLVRAHFHALLEIIASRKGAVVKTIGDAVMATFIRPEHAHRRGPAHARGDGRQLNVERGTEDLIVKIGIHEGPCLAVMLNERQDYFGQTVNIAARVQSLSTSQEIHITGPGDRCARGRRDPASKRRSGRSRRKPRCAASPTRWWCTRYREALRSAETRHARACPGHPRLLRRRRKAWMPGSEPGHDGGQMGFGRSATRSRSRRSCRGRRGSCRRWS